MIGSSQHLTWKLDTIAIFSSVAAKSFQNTAGLLTSNPILSAIS